MKLTISETAKLAGISVRTLHYYDEIGLLNPDYVDEQNGYRYYCESSLTRLQAIMFYRELDFSLKQIKDILSNPEYEKEKALLLQRNLLKIKKKRLEQLINLLDDTLNGGNSMNFKAFDNSEYNTEREKYANEAKERWGETQAYPATQNNQEEHSLDYSVKQYLNQRLMFEEKIKFNIGYEFFYRNIKYKDKIQEILILILDIVTSDSKVIKISGGTLPTEIVKNRFLQLNDSHIEYVLDSIDNCTSEIRNMRSYLLTALYNSFSSIDNYYTVKCNHDMQG